MVRMGNRLSPPRGRIPKPVLVTFLLLGLVALLVLCIFVLPPLLVQAEGRITAVERLQAENAVRATLLQAIGGAVLLAGLYVTWRTFELNRQGHELDREGQVTERFTRAIDQLGNQESMDVRIGGIYALERIARDSPDDHGPIMEVLTAYIREHAPWPPTPAPNSPTPPADSVVEPEEAGLGEQVPGDIQAVLTVLSRRQVSNDPPESTWVLSGTNLQGADIRRVSLQGALLMGTNLRGTNLDEAKLREAYLRHGNLRGASLEGADLRNANLRDANLQEAILTDANLREANLADANLREAVGARTNLREAFLQEANLQRAALVKANLQEAVLFKANLQEAVLSESTLQKGDLSKANLQEAVLNKTNLQGANLSEANLQGATLQDARFDSGTKWPEGFDPSAQGAKRA